jgi:hypothetical protein
MVNRDHIPVNPKRADGLGGHCKPITYLGFRNQAKKYGKDAANHLIEFEEAALEEYAQLVAAEGIDCDLHITRAFDLYLDDKDAESAKADFRARMEDVSGRKAEPSVRSVDDPEELERISGFKGAKWGAHFPAGHLWPYKLATACKSPMRAALTISDTQVH